jgi:hypothetical protein
MTKKERVINWISALRSGLYLQTKRHLRDDFGFCCLGVACDLYDNTKWENLYYYDSYPNVIIPKDITEKIYGIDIRFAGILTRMNDSGKTFPEIADYIEKEILPNIGD